MIELSGANIFIAIILGTLTGIIGGFFGVGGGIIMVPAFLYWFQCTQQTASATSLMAMLLPVGALAVWKYYQAGHVQGVHIKIGLFTSIGLFVGSWLGAKFSIQTSSRNASIAFGILMILIGFRIILRR